MFGLFKDNLKEREEWEIVVLIFNGAMQHFLDTVTEKGKRAGVVSQKEDFSDRFRKDAPELFLGYFFGRLLARSESNNSRIPDLPYILNDKDKVGESIEVLLAPKDKTRMRPRVTARHSLSRKVLTISRNMIEGSEVDPMVGLEKNLNKCLQREGFPEKKIDVVLEIFINDVDDAISDICEEAKEVWQEIPASSEEEAIEQYARMARTAVSDMNSRESYNCFFQKV